jgi:hypothetical protein
MPNASGPCEPPGSVVKAVPPVAISRPSPAACRAAATIGRVSASGVSATVAYAVPVDVLSCATPASS